MNLPANTKIRCIKDGQMDDGRIFAYKGQEYWAEVIEETEPDEDYYEVRDELWDDHYRIYHGMDPEFFKEYFEVIK